MAQRRMTSKSVVETDLFLSMPPSAQNLYFHLNMQADDCGLVSNPLAIQRMCNSAADDLRLLIAKGFVIQFDDGVIALVHWNINNQIRKDRFHPSIHQDDFKRLAMDTSKAYRIGSQSIPLDLPDDSQETNNGQPSDGQVTTTCQPNGNQGEIEFGGPTDKTSSDGDAVTCQPNVNQVTTNGKPRLVKSSLVKTSIGQSSLAKTTSSSAETKLKNLHIKLNQTQHQILKEYVDDLSLEVVCFAIDSMAQYAETPRFNYLCYILSRYQQSGIRTLEKAQADDAAYRGRTTRVVVDGPHIPIYKLGE